MNTLFLGILALQLTAAPDDVASLYDERTYTVPAAEPAQTLKYRLLKPTTVEPGKKYPLLLFMHGAGERGDDNLKQLKYLPEWMASKEYREKYACYMIVPQTNRGWAGARRRAGDAAASEPAPPADAPPSLADGEHAVAMVRAAMKEFPIDESRVYITGLSLGGFGTWATAAKYPELFAAAAPICGGGNADWAGRLKGLPIYAVHGDADRTVPISGSRTMIEAVNKAGGQAKLRELPGVGHDSWTWAYKDPEGVIPWLFEQRKK